MQEVHIELLKCFKPALSEAQHIFAKEIHGLWSWLFSGKIQEPGIGITLRLKLHLFHLGTVYLWTVHFNNRIIKYRRK
jgi:hypothetical protein